MKATDEGNGEQRERDGKASLSKDKITQTCSEFQLTLAQVKTEFEEHVRPLDGYRCKRWQRSRSISPVFTGRFSPSRLRINPKRLTARTFQYPRVADINEDTKRLQSGQRATIRKYRKDGS
jgi:hypothetical protein